ncbi:hypothetical protein PR202_ga22096 [Eleusine coracana subsp. coracana]|uniref:Uncharacterized protein n=1 Tax=Eleusine coracana subsp. coracana TaxID=191504 RepID=A0AAV5D361_ELECO|nr:hypothetical protein QOZ80_9AG0684400 [Eleusine coracana subsp. coracana]GJN04538.1 hypothetical protein PR202_ga22096 [Eleusine coracana subsp. coracana]
MNSRPSTLLLALVLLLPLSVNATRKVYIVYMGEKKHEDPALVTALHHDVLTAVLGSKDEAIKSIVYSYKHGSSGFAAKLTESQAEKLEKYPGVLSVRPNTVWKLHTTRSWDFLGLNHYQPTTSKLLQKAKNNGEDVIVGVIDSGIWPESPSFDDTGYGPVPKRWKGTCEDGETFNATHCNRKIIGARWYSGGDAEEMGEPLSARDNNGHGTHVASTIAGSPVWNASYKGLGAGVARGGAPRVRLAVYKIIWSVGSDYAAVLAAIDDAINDGVDVLSMSLGSVEGDSPFEYPGTLHAVARGITVVFAAGNEGPVTQTVQNAVPWVVTVAATTMDRSFPTVISLGNGEKLVGQSIYLNETKLKSTDFHMVVYGEICNKQTLKSVNFTGKIVLCSSPFKASNFTVNHVFTEAYLNLLRGGARGMIFAEYPSNRISNIGGGLDAFMPWVLVDYEMAHRIASYCVTSRTPVLKISRTVSTVGNGVVSPRVPAFSSRGPSIAYPALLKPDIAAPGTDILAAWFNTYEFKSGTSMSCPHVSAIVALLKSVHPHWSPAMIKSAIVTTASVTDRFGIPIQAEGLPRKPADPFDFGGGHIEPDRAVDPGLVYDIDPKEYFKFFNKCTLVSKDDCTSYIGKLYHLNLPSIAVPDLRDNVTVWRTVTNVGPEKATYHAVVEAPEGVKMSVEPSMITFKKGGPRSVTFKVTFTAKLRVQGWYTFGSLTWKDDCKHSVRIPIAVRTTVQDFVADVS